MEKKKIWMKLEIGFDGKKMKVREEMHMNEIIGRGRSRRREEKRKS